MSQSSSQGNVLVVDDSPTMRRVLASILVGNGYQVSLEESGSRAIARAEAEPPDIFLVDVEMPEMDGFELCEQLKARPTLRDIPVIFISAHSDRFDKIRAFGVGAADYVTKPFDIDEVQARIRTHVELRRLHIRQAEQNALLREQNEQLRALEKLRDDLTHMMVHDLRNPLTCIYGFLKLLDIRGRPLLPPDLVECIESSLGSTQDLIEMVTSLLDINKFEAGAMRLDLESCNLAAVATEVMARSEGLRQNRALTVAPFPEGEATVMADAVLMRRVLTNIVGNALKFTDARTGRVDVSFTLDSDRVRVEVADNGPGIPDEWHDKIFEKFGQVGMRSQRKKYTTGLGLTFCKLAIEAHGGTIGVRSKVGKGTSFWFDLPKGVAPAPEAAELSTSHI